VTIPPVPLRADQAIE